MNTRRPSNGERLAVLETDADHIQIELAGIKEDVKATRADVAEIKQGLNKQKGFIAGIMFVITPIWAALVLYAKTFWDRYIT